jgi:hypothetical protein
MINVYCSENMKKIDRFDFDWVQINQSKKTSIVAYHTLKLSLVLLVVTACLIKPLASQVSDDIFLVLAVLKHIHETIWLNSDAEHATRQMVEQGKT